MKRLSFIFLALYIVDFIVDSIMATYADSTLRYLSKGLLMPLLLAFFITETKAYTKTNGRKYIRLIFFALIFSFLGDIFLIGEGSLNFILGIAAFLIAQVFYIAFFISIKSFSNKHILFLFISAFIILCYLVGLNYLFWPEVNEQHFVIPVLAYSVVLGLMLFTSINTIHAKLSGKTNIYYFIPGAIIFVASDSMIGLNSFYLSTALPGFYIMITYCIAQFLLVYGAVLFIKRIPA